MPLISVIITLIVVGVLLWLVNTYLAAVIDGKILKIINIVVIVIVVLWVLSLFLGGVGSIANIQIGRY